MSPGQKYLMPTLRSTEFRARSSQQSDGVAGQCVGSEPQTLVLLSSDTITVVRGEPEVRKISLLIERAKSYLSTGEARVDDEESRFRLFVHKGLDGTHVDVMDNANAVPGAVRQRWRSMLAGNSIAGFAVHDEDAVVNGDLGSGVFGKVDIVEMKRIHVVEDDNHGTASASDLYVEDKAAHFYALQPRELQGAARDSGRA